MSRIRANRPYRLLARYYDQLFTFHLSWYETARQRVLGEILLHLESACDLACGTGTTALDLARKGIKCTEWISPQLCVGWPVKSLDVSACRFASSAVTCGISSCRNPSTWYCANSMRSIMWKERVTWLWLTCCFTRFAPRRLLLLRREQPSCIRNDLARHVVGGKAGRRGCDAWRL